MAQGEEGTQDMSGANSIFVCFIANIAKDLTLPTNPKEDRLGLVFQILMQFQIAFVDFRQNF